MLDRSAITLTFLAFGLLQLPSLREVALQGQGDRQDMTPIHQVLGEQDEGIRSV